MGGVRTERHRHGERERVQADGGVQRTGNGAGPEQFLAGEESPDDGPEEDGEEGAAEESPPRPRQRADGDREGSESGRQEAETRYDRRQAAPRAKRPAPELESRPVQQDRQAAGEGAGLEQGPWGPPEVRLPDQGDQESGLQQRERRDGQYHQQHKAGEERRHPVTLGF